MLAQLVEDLFHLERRGERLDQHGGADRSSGNAERILCVAKNVVPEACLEMALELRQIEVRTRAVAHELGCVVEEEEAEIDERAVHWPRIEEQMPLREVQAARPNDERGEPLPQPVVLSRRRIIPGD